MTAPALADGDPYHGVIAVMDESAHEAGAGIYYNLTVVRIPETAAVLPDLNRVIGDRRRPFHFSEEGPEAIERMMDLIESAGLVGTSLWSSVGRTRQVAARRHLLREHALRCAADGVDHLSIEGGGDASNQRDRSVILDAFQGDGGVPFRYDWRSKADPVLWIADAVAGSVAAHLLGERAEHYDRLSAGGLIVVEYRP